MQEIKITSEDAPAAEPAEESQEDSKETQGILNFLLLFSLHKRPCVIHSVSHSLTLTHSPIPHSLASSKSGVRASATGRRAPAKNPVRERQARAKEEEQKKLVCVCLYVCTCVRAYVCIHSHP